MGERVHSVRLRISMISMISMISSSTLRSSTVGHRGASMVDDASPRRDYIFLSSLRVGAREQSQGVGGENLVSAPVQKLKREATHRLANDIRQRSVRDQRQVR